MGFAPCICRSCCFLVPLIIRTHYRGCVCQGFLSAFGLSPQHNSLCGLHLQESIQATPPLSRHSSGDDLRRQPQPESTRPKKKGKGLLKSIFRIQKKGDPVSTVPQRNGEKVKGTPASGEKKQEEPVSGIHKRNYCTQPKVNMIWDGPLPPLLAGSFQAGYSISSRISFV